MDYGRIIKMAQDCGTDITQVSHEFVSMWGCDLSSRKLRLTTDESGATEADVDAMALFIELARKHEVIVLPNYKCARPETHCDGETVIKENRHGHVTGVSSNQEVFSAGITVFDHNVMTSSEVGQYRTFMLSDLRGNLDTNRWSEVHIVTENPAVPDVITLTRMVNPGRCMAFYGKPYLTAKALIHRLSAQAKDLRRQLKSMPERLDAEGYEPGERRQVGEVVEIEVDAMEAVLDGMEMTGAFQQYSCTLDGRDAAEAALKEANKLLKMLRFLARMTEKAFYDHAVLPRLGSVASVVAWVGGEGKESIVVAPWTKTTWERKYKPTQGSRLLWARMEMQPGLHLRWRAWTSREKVSNSYDT